jgi:hypothetical protein
MMEGESKANRIGYAAMLGSLLGLVGVAVGSRAAALGLTLLGSLVFLFGQVAREGHRKDHDRT